MSPLLDLFAPTQDAHVFSHIRSSFALPYYQNRVRDKISSIFADPNQVGKAMSRQGLIDPVLACIQPIESDSQQLGFQRQCRYR